MSASTVHVNNISVQTSEKEVRDFFSFCGKINDLKVQQTQDGTAAATVTFEKNTAAKTALLLDNTQLGPNIVQVSAAATLDGLAGTKKEPVDAVTGEHHEINQEDKPRSRIVAEYLAHGYTISDKAIERALALDKEHGISSRFTSALQSFDDKYKASDKTRELDQKYNVSERASSGWQGLSSYFEKALGTPTGQRVLQFYQAGEKQVLDVHTEARRLADLKSGKGNVEQVSGTELTKCNCGADSGKCPCEPGNCACASCPKNKGHSDASKTAADVDPRQPAPPAVGSKQ